MGVKVKGTLVHALRLCTALPFHDHGTRSGWGVSVKPRPLFTPGKDLVPVVQDGWVGPRAGLDRCGKSRPHRDSIQPVASPIPTELPGPRAVYEKKWKKKIVQRDRPHKVAHANCMLGNSGCWHTLRICNDYGKGYTNEPQCYVVRNAACLGHCYLLVRRWAHVHLERLASRLELVRYCDVVSKQTVARHLLANYSSQNGPGVKADTHLSTHKIDI